jgi:prepilin-type N-terminal cleavage/methylation domain-containing protein
VKFLNVLPKQSSTRSAFTLLELLIVIAIIALLMGISFSVMYGLVSQAEEEATIATVRKVDALLQQRIEAFDRTFKGNKKTSAVNGISVLLASQNIFGVRDDVKEILAKKALFRFEFPQRIDERRLFGDPDTVVTGLPDTIFRAVAAPNARQQLVNEGNATPSDTDIQNRVISNWANHRSETESAALLHFALLASDSYGVGAVDGDRFTDKEVADTDGDGLPEFIDAWGNPLRFYRWPTRLIDITAPSPFVPVLGNPADSTDTRQIVGQERELANLLFKGLSPPPLPLPNGVLPRDLLLTDPDDAVGRLYSELERLDGNDGRPLFATEYNESKYHTPETYHTPLIVSAGSDGVLGLREPNDTDFSNGIFGNLAQLAGTTVLSPTPSVEVRDQLTDNITNRNRRAGGRR